MNSSSSNSSGALSSSSSSSSNGGSSSSSRKGVTTTVAGSDEVALNNSHAANKSLLQSLELLSCGVISGFLQAGLFNPWDRALYLSVKENRPFLSLKNFEHPWAGVMHTIAQRAISTGLYFPLEEMYAYKLVEGFGSSDGRRPWIALASGLLAGSTNGLIMNPISSVKYHYWGAETLLMEGKEANFWSTAKDMMAKGGVRIFFVGSMATISRDLVFGGAYALLRHELLANFSIFHSPPPPSHPHASSSSSSSSLSSGDRPFKAPSFMVNLVSACLATILSSPWNYVRNVHYATSPDQKAETTVQILSTLWKETKQEKTLWKQLRHLQTKMRIGWGTARVGCGMAFAAQVYALCSNAKPQ